MNLAENIPVWMNQDFFDKVIRFIEKDQAAKVTKFDVNPGSKAGENFASAIFRSSITYKSKYSKDAKTISVIIKVKPVLGPEMAAYSEIIEKSKFFETEMAFYGKILPDIQSLMLSAGDKDVLSPKLLYQSNEPSPVIVMEDVCVDDFTVINYPPTDFEVSRKIIQRLAKIHAGTFYLISENKLDPTAFSQSIFEIPSTAEMIYGNTLEHFASILNDWKGYEKYAEKFKPLRKTYLSKVLKTYKPNRSEFGYNVINHADFHIRNLLFKKTKDGSIEDFLFIDFQLCNYATPAIDLIYAMYHVLSEENRQTRRDEFIVSYYKQFVESLKAFGYMKSPPSLTDLHIELLKNGILEVLLCVCNTSIYYYDFSTVKHEDFLVEDGVKNFMKKLFETPAFKAMLQKELPRFLYNGFI
ncbi:CLUMA_CG004564, isoform A [Clunio marinus]|uniref:CLUMA_CG004564, isoform A n=1 Tax=Clunio marinus TaxID=568069 RepID=A0A1J1HTI9_9DIPT|nr:CLUMA_CG004564, isoform A [Clunio marinus]